MAILGELPDGRVPVSILTGFLGSGKTTLLKRLLRHPDMSDTAVMINEFGEVGIDDLLVTEIRDELLLLESGCVCCQVMGDLVDSLKNMIAKREDGDIPRFSRVLLETTGLADPVPVVKTLIDDPALGILVVPGVVVTTVDAVAGFRQLDEHPESVRQAGLADRIVITKVDLAEAKNTESLASRLRSLNRDAQVFESIQGGVSPLELMAPGPTQTEALGVRDAPLVLGKWLAGQAATGAHHSEGIRSFSVTLDEPVELSRAVRWLREVTADLGDRILRIKGVLNAARRPNPVVVQSVGNVLYPMESLAAWPCADRRSRLVFITWKMTPSEVEALEREFRAVLTGK